MNIFVFFLIMFAIAILIIYSISFHKINAFFMPHKYLKHIFLERDGNIRVDLIRKNDKGFRDFKNGIYFMFHGEKQNDNNTNTKTATESITTQSNQ